MNKIMMIREIEQCLYDVDYYRKVKIDDTIVQELEYNLGILKEKYPEEYTIAKLSYHEKEN